MGRAASIFAIILLVLAVFGRTIGHGLLRWDDELHLKNNPHLQNFSCRSVVSIWSDPYAHLYIPVSYSVFAALGHFGGLLHGTPGAASPDPRTFHAACIGLHILNSIVVLVLLKRVVPSEWAAFAGAGVFALHPLAVESVAWISEMRGLLAACFGLLAILGIVRQTFTSYLAGSAFLVLALLSKPSAAVVPLLAWLWMWLEHGRAAVSGRALMRLGAWLILAVAVLVLTSVLQSRSAQPPPVAWWQRAVIAADALGFYVAKLVWPVELSPVYARTPQVLLGGAWKQCLWLIPLSVGALMVATLRLGVHPRAALGAAGIFVVTLLPVLGLTPFHYQTISTVADRYAYLALLGPALLVSIGIDAAIKSGVRVAWTASSTALLGLALLAGLSFAQARHWRDDRTLFTHALRLNPENPTSLNNLGYHLQLSGKLHEAIPLFRKSLELNPNNAPALINLAVALFDLGDPSGAEQCYRRAIALDPTRAEPHNGLGLILAQRRDVEGARLHFEQAARLAPHDPEPLNNLSLTYLDLNQPERALRHLDAASALRPGDPTVLHNRGLALARLGRVSEAAAAWNAVLRIVPDQIPTLLELGHAMILLNRPDDAERHFRRVLELEPNTVSAQKGLERVQKRRNRP